MASLILTIWLGGMAVAFVIAAALRQPTKNRLGSLLSGVAIVAWPLMVVGGIVGLLVEGVVRLRCLIAAMPAATCP